MCNKLKIEMNKLVKKYILLQRLHLFNANNKWFYNFWIG